MRDLEHETKGMTYYIHLILNLFKVLLAAFVFNIVQFTALSIQEDYVG